MEPRFSIPDSTPRSSKTPLVVSGLQIYIYGLEDLKTKAGVEVAVLWLAHNRTRNYLVTEGIAHEVLSRYRRDVRKKNVEFIAVTFNMRNHGDREVCYNAQVSPPANKTWKDGNEAHGIDLLSLIDGSALDFQLLISYLPAYLPQFTHLRTVMAGVSLGGHTAWRMAALVPDIEAFSMTVGCPNLTALMLSRLGVDSKKLGSTPNELYKVLYDDLAQVLDDTQKRRWPRRLHEITSGQDRKIAEEFPDVPLLLMGGKQDPLVPVKFTMPWVEERSGNPNVEFFVQDNTGHSCTKEMVFKLAVWLGDMFAVEK